MRYDCTHVGIVVLTIRFLCELGALAAVGWWGYHVHVALAIVLPLVVGIVWGLFVAPRAKTRLRDPWRFLVESLVWIGATAALATMPAIASVFGALALVTAMLARRYEPAATATR